MGDNWVVLYGFDGFDRGDNEAVAHLDTGRRRRTLLALVGHVRIFEIGRTVGLGSVAHIRLRLMLHDHLVGPVHRCQYGYIVLSLTVVGAWELLQFDGGRYGAAHFDGRFRAYLTGI